jgi:hypothetical protein
LDWPLFTVVPERLFPNYTVEQKSLDLDLVGSLDPDPERPIGGKINFHILKRLLKGGSFLLELFFN